MHKKNDEEWLAEVQELRTQLEEAQETLNAIRRGEVDGLVVSTPKGEQVYTISGAEKPYRALIEDMREGAVMLSDDDTVLYCNSGFAKIMKNSIEKIVGLNIESMVCPTHLLALRKLLTLARAQKSAVTKEITLQANGDILVPTLMSINSLQSDTLNNTFLVVTDLTEHMEKEVKRYTNELELAQIALSESEQRWATTLASIGDAVIAADISGKIKFMNNVAEKLTGWTLVEAAGRPVNEVFNIINEFTRKTVDDPVTKVLEKGTIVGLANHTLLVRKDKTEIAIDDSGAPIKSKNCKTTGVVLIFRDVTEHRKAEEALKMSERKFKSLADNAPDVIMRFNPDLRVTYLNPKVKVATGIPSEQFLGKTNEEMGMPRELVEMWNDMFRKSRESRQAQQREFDFPSPNGLKTFDLRVVPEYDEKDALISFLGISRDVTERKEAEEKLEEYASQMERLADERAAKLKDAERLAAIGATAGMVGHDIRNPLQAIISDVFIAKCDLEKSSACAEKDSVLECLSEIEKNVDYINKIVADLQDYSKVLKPVLKEIDLEPFFNDILFKNSIPKKIDVACIVDGQAKTIMADPDLLKRILTNLISNAVNAMPNGGKLALHAFKEKGDIRVTVQDTGVGVPDEIKPKLFTPLFTTRAKGQGFGLPVVKRMTEALGGEVTFESQVGKGTKFTIRLPPQKLRSKMGESR